jgi:hypothetical protein
MRRIFEDGWRYWAGESKGPSVDQVSHLAFQAVSFGLLRHKSRLSRRLRKSDSKEMTESARLTVRELQIPIWGRYGLRLISTQHPEPLGKS